jgi:hypothetical protein
MNSETWAREEFGDVDLGDKRRNARLVMMARRFAEAPGGTVTKVYTSAPERQGAYKLLENENAAIEEMERARGGACARRMADLELAVVPVDQTSINLGSSDQAKDFGSIGTRSSGAIGVHVMTALALDAEGVPLGVLCQDRWSRNEEPSPAKGKDKRSAEERESYYWIYVLNGCLARLRENAPGTRAWFQADQGADYWRLFAWAHEHDALLTVRLCRERVVINRGRENYLHPWIANRPVAYNYEVELPERPGRPSRVARLSVRFGTTTIMYKTTPGKTLPLEVSVVAVTEPRPPAGVEPIDWLLATTYSVRTDEDAARVIAQYSNRWRTEEFHRTLKSGACEIEASGLESFESFSRFLIIASSVAARIERIKYLSRTQPDLPATAAYSKEEIEVMRKIRFFRVWSGS